MHPKGSVTRWIEGVKEGDPAAAQALWDRYFAKLVRLARQKLEDVPCRMADEEDVVLSAFDSFCRAPPSVAAFPIWRIAMAFGGCY